jgi:hypothetical protein
MIASADVIKGLVALFHRQPCWMILPLAQQVNYSIPSVRRFLVKIGYFSSFTHNGRWYTLSTIPQFDARGLWFHRDIGFSRAGSLTKTLIALVDASPEGLTADQVGQTLRCRCHSVLVNLYRKGRLQREKSGRCHRYYAADPDTADRQRAHGYRAEPAMLPAEIAVLVLAEFIRAPESGFTELAKTVSGRTSLSIDAGQIEDLFSRHGLKKTL